MSNTTLNESNFNPSVTDNTIQMNAETIETSIGETSIGTQLNKVKQLIFVDDTAHTFRQSLTLLMSLAKESLILIWLGLCWSIVAINWFIDQGKSLGTKLKQLQERLYNFSQNRTKEEIVSDATQTMTQKSKDAIQHLVVKAKKQVGVQDT